MAQQNNQITLDRAPERWTPQRNTDGRNGSRTQAASRQETISGAPAGEPPIREVRAGCIGRGHAGKTALFRALIEGPIGDYFPSGLHVDVGDPKQAAKMIRDAEETRRILEMGGLPPTLEASEIRYYLYDGDEPRVTYYMREVIGQILTHTLPDSDQELQARYDEYLRSLLDTDVLWTVIPVPPPNASTRDKRRYANDLRLTSAYLREALRQRSSDDPCGVALVITKIDTLFADEKSAQQALTDDVLIEALGPLVNTVRRSSRVEDAAIFPVTAFGFGNAIQRKLNPEDNNRAVNVEDNTFADEPVWMLREGAMMQPYNLSTLILWTLHFSLYNQIARMEKEDSPEIAEVCQMLREDMEAEPRWFVPVKGCLESKLGRRCSHG